MWQVTVLPDPRLDATLGMKDTIKDIKSTDKTGIDYR